MNRFQSNIIIRERLGLREIDETSQPKGKRDVHLDGYAVVYVLSSILEIFQGPQLYDLPKRVGLAK
jgi:hypothetical protein